MKVIQQWQKSDQWLPEDGIVEIRLKKEIAAHARDNFCKREHGYKDASVPDTGGSRGLAASLLEQRAGWLVRLCTALSDSVSSPPGPCPGNQQPKCVCPDRNSQGGESGWAFGGCDAQVNQWALHILSFTQLTRDRLEVAVPRTARSALFYKQAEATLKLKWKQWKKI
jgi:hypothetical protein